MNIILLGNNGAGKTTMAQRIHKKGFHLIKEAPTGNNHLPLAMLTLVDGNWVMDRWNVIDRLIYENEKGYLDSLLYYVPTFNKHNIIIYLKNLITPYDDSFSEDRVIQRPSETELLKLNTHYEHWVERLQREGFNIHKISVNEDEDITFEKIRKVVNEHAKETII